MRFTEAYRDGRFGLSFEIFPPKTAAGDVALYASAESMMLHRPSFVTVTYGAAGTTREKTLELAVTLRERYGVSTAAHLTCVGSSRDDLRDWLKKAADRGIENIVAQLEAHKDDPEAELEIGVNHAIRQCRELLDAGVPGLHFYVLNRAVAPFLILDALTKPCM